MTPAPRILHCIPSMEGGGAERQLTYLARELCRRGWDVHVALVAPGPNLERLARSGAAVHRLDIAGNYDPRLFFELARVVRRTRPDLIQTWLLQMDIAAGLVALATRTPFVLTERCGPLELSVLKPLVRRLVGRGASAIVSNSPGGDRAWSGLRADAPIRRIIANGLPLDEIAATPTADASPFGIEPEDRVVLHAGRFTAQKNLHRLIPALTSVLTAHERVKAVLFGDGPLKAGIVELVNRQGLSGRVQFPGYVQDLWAWLKRADVFVSVSLYEGHPNTLCEAVACGCRIVASDIDAHRSVLTTGSAPLVDPEDEAGIRDALVRALEAGRLPPAEATAARATLLSVEVNAAGFDELYQRLLGLRLRARRAAGAAERLAKPADR